jgi:hypothetical protein
VLAHQSRETRASWLPSISRFSNGFETRRRDEGKKGLLTGSEVSGYLLTELSRRQYADLRQLVAVQKVQTARSYNAADRTISALDEALYKRLRKTPAYEKLAHGREQEIVETERRTKSENDPVFLEMVANYVFIVVAQYEAQKQHEAGLEEERSDQMLLFRQKFFKLQRELIADKDISYFESETLAPSAELVT